jgi:SHAQKYF class myb-like DNA-binding protein
MTSFPPVADPTASMPPSTTISNVTLPPAPCQTVNPTVVPAPPVATIVPTPVPVATAPEATAVALAAAAAAADPQVSGTESANSDSVPKVTGKAASKKKKNQVTVAMAAATNSISGSQGAQGENTGRWTAEEHRLFLQGLELHGKGWKKIAGLIKSRTVVQIRTHAQKYFQKLAKAKQNGEDGEILMDARGGSATVPSVTTSAAQNNKRRKQTSGTKRKAIQSVVVSAQCEAKKMSIGSDDDGPVGITSVAPALAPYILPVANPMEDESHGTGSIPSITTSHGTISGPALEDSLYVHQPWI